jgi:endonuclease YncB( thermonuclease family)
MRRRTLMAALTGLVLLIAVSAAPAVARSCFPETNQCLDGRIEQHWQQNGGLPVFGFPITPQAPEINRDAGQTYQTQWMERNRFELHPEHQPPYDVLLGRLGDDRLRQLGIDWQTLPKAEPVTLPPTVGRYFPETGHMVRFEFWDYWNHRGLDLGDPGVSDRESLALFGYPLSEARIETNTSGDTVLTQWFERARFELHPGNPPEHRVLLGLLGNEVRMGQPPAGQAPAFTPPPDLAAAVVVNVVDGDTIDVQLDGTTERLRLIGMDTPETVDPRVPVQCYGREASAKARELLLGQTVRLEADPSQGERDAYDRLLRYIWLADGRLINLEMIAQGYAHEYTYRTPYKYQQAFRAAEQAARAAGLGLWSPATRNGNTEQPADPSPPAPISQPTPRPQPTPAPTPPPSSNCHPSYPTVCIPPPPPDLDCGDIPYRNFRVVGSDPHRFDGDNNGIGCER